jgi:hypothetical protein
MLNNLHGIFKGAQQIEIDCTSEQPSKLQVLVEKLLDVEIVDE